MGQPQHTAEISGVEEVAQPSLPVAHRDQQGAEAVSSQLCLKNEHPSRDSLESMVNFLHAAGRGWSIWRKKPALSTDHKLVRAQLTHSPLAACAHSQAGSTDWLLTYLQKDWWDCRLSPQPLGQCLLLASVHNWLDFWLTPNLWFSRARERMDKARCQILLWHFKQFPWSWK